MSLNKLVAFFVLFASFERSLRDHDKFQPIKKTGLVKIDLYRIGVELQNPFYQDCSNEILKCCKYLSDSNTAPRRYCFVDETPEWKLIPRERAPENLGNVLIEVQQVRSNVFHGGKSLYSPSMREVALVEKSTMVLLRLFDICDELCIPPLFDEMYN